uniref:Uncharacterized protein n=1 Tax=Tanacetum cinerariifolium TaxID=118510 RepID=A0A699IIA3_TANCI|nr:hypothetical protein [Tanacetum cinerariifolium]
MSDKKITQPLAPEKPTEPIPQPKQFPHSETHWGGPSSEQHTQGSLTDKEYHELLELLDEEVLRHTLEKDEEVLRQTLKEEARAEKE